MIEFSMQYKVLSMTLSYWRSDIFRYLRKGHSEYFLWYTRANAFPLSVVAGSLKKKNLNFCRRRASAISITHGMNRLLWCVTRGLHAYDMIRSLISVGRLGIMVLSWVGKGVFCSIYYYIALALNAFSKQYSSELGV